MYIEAAATFQDFAFTIHSEIGLHFDYVTIDVNKTHRKPYEKSMRIMSSPSKQTLLANLIFTSLSM